uniref:RxLR effector protein n=1 Tax=Phytophthora agathidicida TaxID=1642459 RepID=A0A7G4WI01_9STRA|nr:PaRXLR12 [Phytophthora agathidicida]
MRSSKILLLAAAILFASADAVSAEEQTKLSAAETLGVVQAGNAAHQTDATRYLRSHPTMQDQEERAMFSSSKESTIVKKLKTMLTNEKYRDSKFAQWHVDKIKFDDIESFIKARGEHFGTIYTQYLVYVKRLNGFK